MAGAAVIPIPMVAAGSPLSFLAMAACAMRTFSIAALILGSKCNNDGAAADGALPSKGAEAAPSRPGCAAGAAPSNDIGAAAAVLPAGPPFVMLDCALPTLIFRSMSTAPDMPSAALADACVANSTNA